MLRWDTEAPVTWQATPKRDGPSALPSTPGRDERVRANTGTPAYGPVRLLDGRPNAVYLCATLQEQKQLRPLFATLVQELLSFAHDRAAQENAPINPPLPLLLDEPANIAPIPDLDAIAAPASARTSSWPQSFRT